MKKKGGKNGDREDAELWRRVTRSVRPYAPQKTPVSPLPETGKKPAKPAAPPAPGGGKDAKAKAKPKAKTPRAREMDAATRRRMARGHMEIEARIDLHGMRRHEAEDALRRFVRRAHARGQRMLLVITGKGGPGSGSEGGVLRRHAPEWLAEEPCVLAVTQAKPADGGAGALYVRLRRA